MYQYGLTRKQCGLIFKAWKDGRILATEEMIRWMYDNIQDAKVFINSVGAEFLYTMHKVIDHIVAGEDEMATIAFCNAFGRYNATFKTEGGEKE